jgi:site-specific DNA recombinase
MSKRVLAYSRVSGEKQDTEDHFSISEQRAAIEEYCQRKDYTSVAHYVDNKRYKSRGRWVEPSGTRSDRPQFQAMLKAVRNGEGDLIVAWKGDRLYRGIYSAVALLEALDEGGVGVKV